MKLKRLIFFVVVLLAGLSCNANNGDHGFPKAWEKWRTEVEKDSGRVIAYSVKRGWVLYIEHHPDALGDNCAVRNMRKSQNVWSDDGGYYSSEDFNQQPVNIDTCKTNFVFHTWATFRHAISKDGRALVSEYSERVKTVTYTSLETGDQKTLLDTSWHIMVGDWVERDASGFDTDSTFYCWEKVYTNKKGKVVNGEKVSGYIVELDPRNNVLANMGVDIYRGILYKDYYRKVRYNTQGKKLGVGKLVRARKMMDEWWRGSDDTLTLDGWRAQLYDVGRKREVDDYEIHKFATVDGRTKLDSLLRRGEYVYYYRRQDGWAEELGSKLYTKAAALFLEKQKWGNHDEVPQDGIFVCDRKHYRWMPVLCDAEGRVASDAAIYPDIEDEYGDKPMYIKPLDVKEVEEAMRAGKIHYRYRRMWYDGYDRDYMGCESKLYTQDEVVDIEKDHFRWPEEWPEK